MSVTVVVPVDPVATKGTRITFVTARPDPGGGGKIGPRVRAAISAPVETSTLFSVDVRIVATAVPAYAKTPIASVDAVTSRSATRGAVVTRRDAR